ncbi:cobyric acid synthase [Fodinisporobacter ferrooxydans]|uniref:Cobyric acid synthase n=1 Tax=Fodinisporobacter ferrooxydans TaxID=2901836 RepID=A0ABY4CKN8_9BACL|nr:cobyric acid synthase [Alicyclobacillaceae bacterium MYW30-H2]
MGKAIPIMIQGTSSDAGKSVIATAFCRIFKQDGFLTAPFKSQNMALNSYVTVDGKEIGRAQGVQAEAAGIDATTEMNPILIKPTRDLESQIVVNGEPFANMKAMAYRSDFFAQGLQVIKQSYHTLSQIYERIVIEGAGSPAEINLNDRELVNMRVAKLTHSPVILVADIERGGVFASLVGTLQLLDEEDRKRVIGVIINKFRGDLALLKPGLAWFERYTGKPVLGVIPFLSELHIDAEDSLILPQLKCTTSESKEIDIAVIQYPKISNFTDVDPFRVEPDCQVRHVTHANELGEPDLVIFPGSKNTMEDLLYLRTLGLEERLGSLYQKRRSMFVGICGGYQMLGKEIHDPDHVESPHARMQGFGWIPMKTQLETKKITRLSTGQVITFGTPIPVKGYEIHMGISEKLELVPDLIQMNDHMEGTYVPETNVLGTYFHGIFHNDEFRKTVLNRIRLKKGLPIMEQRPSFLQLREQSFDILADHVRKHVQMEFIYEQMDAFHKREETLV